MTDVIRCPECNGTGRHLLGRDPAGRPFAVVCAFCHGRGRVGGDDEPAERGVRPEPGPARLQAVWETPGWAVQGCRSCAGAGEVLSLGGQITGGHARRGSTRPCPACRPDQATEPSSN
jgi:hypothetical protein